jgi:putative transposase
MNTYKRHRFPPDIISYAVWLYYRFNLSHRDIEDLLAERGIIVTRESIRLWCIKFGAIYARRLKRKHRGYGDTFYIDEVFIKINGKQHYLWRAVDQDGEVVDVYLQTKRDGAAAKRFFRRLLRSHGGEPRQIVTDKLRSYGVAHRELVPETIHVNDRYANNRAEQSHEATSPSDDDAPLCQKIFNIPMAKIKTVVEPNSVVNDVWWESVAFIGIHRKILPIRSS